MEIEKSLAAEAVLAAAFTHVFAALAAVAVGQERLNILLLQSPMRTLSLLMIDV
jgi:hypothetical protein